VEARLTFRKAQTPRTTTAIYERPNLTGEKISVSNRSPNNWFNTNAFTPSILVYGNSPRNPVVGPGKHEFDLSLGKIFKMPFNEKPFRCSFGRSFSNAFNTPQFAITDRFLGDGDFRENQPAPTCQSRAAIRFEI